MVANIAQTSENTNLKGEKGREGNKRDIFYMTIIGSNVISESLC